MYPGTLSHSDRDALIRSGQLHRCRTCQTRGTVYCPGGEIACHACRGTGYLAVCPLCHGDEVIEVYDPFADDMRTVPCECAPDYVAPIAA